ncbi:MAG: hypothetical protein ABJA98_02705 [Acidobacteriota bacterium]
MTMTDGRVRHPFLCFVAIGALLFVGGVVASHRLRASPRRPQALKQSPLPAPKETAPEETAPSAVIGLGKFSRIVANLERSMAFSRDGLGLELSGPVRPFDANMAIMKAANVMGAQTRYVVLKVPGSTL